MNDKHYQILGGTKYDTSDMVWSKSKNDWTDFSKDDGTNTTFYTREAAEEMLERAQADCGHLVNVRIEEYEVEVEEVEEE